MNNRSRSRRRQQSGAQIATTQANAEPTAEVFSFGDPEPALNQTMLDYLSVWRVHQYFEPPLPWDALAKILRASPHHTSAIALRRNLLTRFLKPSRYLKKQDFSALVMDYLTFGNCFSQRIVSRSGKLLSICRAMTRFTRVGSEPGRFWHLPNDPYRDIAPVHGEPYPDGSIYHLYEPDVAQDIYGMPDYLSAIHSALLNEAATLFRRRYYVNGTHAGYILYMTDALQQEIDIKTLRDKMKESKGPGNFRNLLLYAPGGKKDGVQLIHTGEAAAKDEFLRVKNVSRDDVLAAHRVPPQLIGLVPENNGGFGSAKDAMLSFYQLEILPLQEKFQALNDWAGVEVVAFETPDWAKEANLLQ